MSGLRERIGKMTSRWRRLKRVETEITGPAAFLWLVGQGDQLDPSSIRDTLTGLRW
ncbi:hypothetical protein Micbo1qcDRAFT_160186 [Microdochium bolleyi]|uniref:Uncharacterized protein n=1 Tax=Microdochium bolleyi TaxID=196109 RepID=A0A136JCJ2_9PEZI|nr:hypothetical protein Micbo1qcDRAFT_160186 [Microdochium bolleyi]